MADTVPVLSAEERAGIAEDHGRYPDADSCYRCDEHWPCPVVRLLAERAALVRRCSLYAGALGEISGCIVCVRCRDIAQVTFDRIREEATDG